MKLYYHQTAGGAEYYCLTPVEKQPDGTVEGTEVGDLRTAVIRVDGNEIELITRNIFVEGIKIVID